MTLRSDPIEMGIDEVASQMTAGEPGLAFRAHVMARIASGAAPRRSWRASFVLAPAAVLALVMVAIFVTRVIAPNLQPPTVAGPDTGNDQPLAAGGDGGNMGRAPAASAIGQTARAGSNGPLARATARTAHGASTMRNDRSRPAPALDLIATPLLDATPLTTEPISADLLRIDRLDSIPTMDVAPLGIDDERRRQE